MKILSTGDIFIGKNYAGMINDAINTNYSAYQKATVNFANVGVCAWFVYMDGSIHGYPDGWVWRNILSPDGKTIREYNVSEDKNKLYERRNEDGYGPFKLCFQIDPNGTGNKYWCKFVGAFRLSKFLSEDLSVVEYVKVLDEFKIASIGDGFNSILNTKEDLLIDANIYKVPISKMGFSPNVLQLLSGGGIAYSGELLELGIGVKGKIAEEIRKKIYECFH